MSRLTSSDVAILKKVSKPSPDYEFFIEPLLILFDLTPLKKINAKGVTVVSNWQAASKLIFSSFLKSLRNYQIDFITDNMFLKLSCFIETNPRFTYDNAFYVNPALGNLVSWVFGVY